MISIIVAMDENGLIGKNNELPWYLPNDLKYFKRITTGNTILMGRKTFESIGKPLPNRKNVILTRNKKYSSDNITVINTVEEIDKLENNGDLYIIGGAEIFEALIDITDKLYITKIYSTFDGDVFFPEIEWDKWEIDSVEKGLVDENNIYPHDFFVFKRK
ncbi:MAG: Dihydrofolate reductase [Bacillales bacterium]|jgi:dihydrofolate reductase|nr:Dihydrofolate reductase [Bacillales bacterium]